MVQSGSSTTPASTKVVSGSTMPAPASMCSSSSRRRRRRSASARSTRVLTPMVRHDVVGDVADDAPAVLAQDRQHVGQVQLALGVVGPQPRQRAAQGGGVEGVEAGVDLGDREDVGRRVGSLDDVVDAAVGVAHDAAVGVRRRHVRGEQRGDGVAVAVRATTSRSRLPRISGVSPETTSTSPSKSPSASMPQRTASPVPRASAWIAAIASSGSSSRTSSASGGVTTTSRVAPASARPPAPSRGSGGRTWRAAPWAGPTACGCPSRRPSRCRPADARSWRWWIHRRGGRRGGRHRG